MSTLPDSHATTNKRSIWDTEIGRTYARIKGTRMKWGYVVYRTTYLNDEEWDRVKQIITHRATRGTKRIPDLLNYMEWIFVDDKATLDGASRAYLRQRFRVWAADTAREIGYDLEEEDHSRFFYFLEIDEESLRSIIDNTVTHDRGISVQGHVNVVDSLWEPNTQEFDSEEDRLEELECQKLMEPIDGCREHIVGWIKVRANVLTPEFQNDLDHLMEGNMWDRMYTRPPQLSGYW